MIETTTNKIVYNGDGSTREWSLTVPTTSGGTTNLPIQNYTTDIELYVSNKTTEELTKITSNYEINATTHKVIYPTVASGLSVLTTNQQLIILRATPITQEKDHNTRLFKSEDVEQIADKLTMVTQDLKEITDRAVCVPLNASENDKIDAKKLIQDIKNLDTNVLEVEAEIAQKLDKTEAASTYATKTELNTGLSSKQNTLVSGTNIKTVNGNSVLGSGNLVVQANWPEQTGNSGKFLSTNGTDVSWQALPEQVQSDWNQTDNTKADYIKNKPAIPVVPTNVSAFDNDAGYLTQHQDISDKANLSGGNSFTGTQTVSVDNGTNIVRFPGSTTLTYTNISQNSSGLKIDCSGALDPNLYFNNSALLRKTYTISSFPATLATNTNYNATLNGSVSITLPTPSITAVENVINILLNVTSSSTIDWGVNANVAMTTFATGKYLIKLRYDNSSSQWIGEVLKGESVSSTTKAYFSFNDSYADGTGNTTLTPVSGYTPTFSDEVTAFAGRKSLFANSKYFTPAFNSPIVLSGPFTIKFWIRKDYYNSFAILADAYAGESVTPYDILSCTRSNMILYGPKSSDAADGYGTVVYNIDLQNNLGSYMHYVEISRDSNNTVRLFVDGVVQSSSAYSNDIYVRPTKMFKGSAYLQDFVIEAQVGHTSDYTVPTAPYSISEQSLPDYHDDTKQNSLNNTQLSAVNSGIDTTKVGQIATNTSNITTINDKIPAQATSSNQLADKNFVNSSIATNTANFIGTFNSLADLQAYSGTVTNNDYAFVIDTDTAGNTLYERYKYNGTSWVFEYALNNSGFTAAQWAAINSGITAALVSLIGTALQSVPFATSSTIGGVKIEVDEVNHIANIITED